jgi:MFS family permease
VADIAGVSDKTLSDTKSNFGFHGWVIIILQGLLFWIASGSMVHGLNIILPALSSSFHLDYNTMLAWATPASWASIGGAFVCARICERKGAKFVTILSLAISGGCFGLLGTWSTLVGFVVLFAGVCFFDVGFAYVGGITLMTSWFPRKKGLALGWATMGQTTSTAFYVPFLAWLFTAFGVRDGFWGISACMVAMIFAIALFAKNTPEEQGCTPDNDPMTPEQIAESRRQQAAYVCPFTVKQLLCMKDAWFMGTASGALFIVLVGVISQLVPRLVTMGYDLNTAILYLTIASLIGGPGAYFWGWLNQKIGTKPAIIVYALWWLGAVVLNIFMFDPVTLWIFLFMIGGALGGCTNLTTSLVATKFHRGAFIVAWGIIQPIQSILRCCAFAILAFGLTYLGGYPGAYGLLVVVDLIALILIWKTDLSPVE